MFTDLTITFIRINPFHLCKSVSYFWLWLRYVTRYVPEAWIAGLLGRQNSLAVVTTALIVIRVYTGNLAALPLVGELWSEWKSLNQMSRLAR